MELNFVNQNNIGVLHIVGRLDAYNSSELKSYFDQISLETTNHVFEMGGCEFIDSTGLGTIVACLKAASQNGGDIRLANLQDKPRMVFDITRAYKIFHIFDDIDAALMSFDSDF